MIKEIGLLTVLLITPCLFAKTEYRKLPSPNGTKVATLKFSSEFMDIPSGITIHSQGSSSVAIDVQHTWNGLAPIESKIHWSPNSRFLMLELTWKHSEILFVADTIEPHPIFREIGPDWDALKIHSDINRPPDYDGYTFTKDDNLVPWYDIPSVGKSQSYRCEVKFGSRNANKITYDVRKVDY